MDRLELQRLRDLPIEGVAERLGLQVTRHKCLCPFHEDHHPSMSFSIRRNTYRCFVCGEHGGTIDLVMKQQRLGFPEACRWLADGSGFMVNGSSTSEAAKPITGFEKPQTSDLSHQTSFKASRYERFFERPFLNDEARRFLFNERKLDPRVVRWCRLTSWKDRQGTPWLQIPYYDMEGKLIGVQNRRLRNENENQNERRKTNDEKLSTNDERRKTNDENHEPLTINPEPRFRFPAGSRCGIYNLPVLKMLKPGEELYITEGCSDCWAMLSSGHKAIAIPSATLLSKADKEQLSIVNCQLSIKINMFPDADVPGERLFLQLKEVLPDLVRHQLPEGCKDYSDYFLRVRS